MNQAGYDTLMPVADLETHLRERMLVLVQNPREWTNSEPDDETTQEVYSQFMQQLTREARALAERRVWRERMSEWKAAYGLSGGGSTFKRAHLIAEQVYDRAAPIPDDTPSPDRNQFLHEVIAAVDRAAAAAEVQLS
jgi:hypothetical protein